ncbi:MAG: sensor histidine kinase [Acidimicrobiales bacterium]
MTLRLRLLLVLVGLVAAGLLVADVVTYNSLGSFLDSRLDQQLTDAANPVARALVQCAQLQQGFGPNTFGPGQVPSFSCNQYLRLPEGSNVPSGTFGELRDGSGDVVGQPVFFLASGGSPPALPSDLPGSGPRPSNAGTQYFTTSGTGGRHIHYRVLAVAQAGGGTLVVAIPSTDVDQTLGRLLWIEGLVTAGVLLSLGAMSWWIVRRGLRPLDDMATTAGAIAAGDLSRRVPDVTDGSEVGKLSQALNVMLGNIEQAFAAKEASEERLRRFLADASHELRTPLTSIRGYAEIFDRGARDRPEDLATSMRHIRTEADRMSELVNDLLLLARLDRERPLELERVDLWQIAEEATGAARVSAPDRTITLDGDHPVFVDGDASRLRQILDNLLANARRHTPAGTGVAVHVGSDGGDAVIEVADDGPGVAPEDRARIFEPFHRADPSRARSTGGVGLGLAIVAAITRAHGGSVGVRSGPSGGAVFWVRVPLAATSAPHRAPGTEPNGTGRGTPPVPVGEPGVWTGSEPERPTPEGAAG